jgi:hypothetical protein
MKPITSKYIKTIAILIGGMAFVFYMPLFAGALVNFPVSWFGIIYSTAGLTSLPISIHFIFKPKWWKLIYILSTLIPIFITLIIL